MPDNKSTMASATPRELLDVGGRELAVTNPQKVLFPVAGYTKLDLVRYYLAVAEGRCAPPANGRTCSCVIPTASAASSSIRSARRLATRVARSRLAEVSLRPQRRGGGASGRGGTRVDGEPGVPGAPSASGARRRPGPPRRIASRPGPGAWRGVGAGPRGCTGGQGDPGRSWSRRLAQDIRVTGHARARPHRTAVDVRPGATRRPGAGP